ncbi:MAG: PqqD family protein [Sphingomicrobium sp.]|nr:PqqD family protein [Sphingomonadales bacterium]
MSGTIYQRSKQLMEAALGDELVALDPEGGHCFAFNAPASAVWRLLEIPRSRESLRDALLEQFEVEPNECASDVATLLEDLMVKGLIKAVS